MPTTRSTRSRSEARYALIHEYLDQPDITQREFCLSHRIAYSTFQLYLRKVRQSQVVPKSTEATGRFVPLALPGFAIASSSQSTCELVWPNGILLRFRENPSPEYLMALIKAGQSGL
jgi:hypothetical protein